MIVESKDKTIKAYVTKEERMKEGIIRITKGGKITDTEIGREVIRMINKEKNKLKNCSSRYRKLMERHNNLIKRHSELRDNYSILKLKHNHVEDKYKSLTQVNKRLRKELKEGLIKIEWTEVEKEREGTHGELQVYNRLDEHFKTDTPSIELDGVQKDYDELLQEHHMLAKKYSEIVSENEALTKDYDELSKKYDILLNQYINTNS